MGRKETTQKKICVGSCKKSLPLSNFYNSNSPLYPDGKLSICKNCLKDMVDVTNIGSVKSALRLIDKPFIGEEWMTSLKSNAHPFGDYIKKMNSLPQYKTKTYDDSVYDGEKIEAVVSLMNPDAPKKILYEVTPDLIEKWGSGYTSEDYHGLERFYLDMKKSYKIETASHKDYLKKICKVSIKMDKALDGDDIDGYKKLSDAYDKMMHSAKFTAVQRTQSDSTGGLNTFGEFFEHIEREGFIPRFVTDEPQDIVDQTINNMMGWTRKLVLGDPNITSLVDASLAKMRGGEDIEEEVEDATDEFYEHAEEEYHIDLVDEDDE